MIVIIDAVSAAQIALLRQFQDDLLAGFRHHRLILVFRRHQKSSVLRALKQMLLFNK